MMKNPILLLLMAVLAGACSDVYDISPDGDDENPGKSKARAWKTIQKVKRNELYDHRNDPHEWHNLAQNPAFNDIKKELKAELLKMTGRD
jgi:hypothetical protein